MTYNLEKRHRPHDVSKQVKGNGETRGRVNGHNWNPNELGVNYPGGLGCTRHPNCFTCELKDCKFNNGPKHRDLTFISNRGEGIKVW